MIVFKRLKKNSKISLRSNYFITVITGLLGLVLLSLYSGTVSAMILGLECFQNYYDNGNFMTNGQIDRMNSDLYDQELDLNTLYSLSYEQLRELGLSDPAIKYLHSLTPAHKAEPTLAERLKVKYGVAKQLLYFANFDLNVIFDNVEDVSISVVAGRYTANIGVTAVLGLMAMIFYRLFFANVLQVGYARFFLENSKYHKTRISRNFFAFQKNYFKVWRAMSRKTIYQFFWNFTIVGGIIKVYSYKLVPYVIAENPTVSSKKAIYISRCLMNGYKWKAFLLDLSLLGWRLLGSTFFGLIGICYANPYIEGVYAEFYKALVKERRKEEFYKEYLGDKQYWDNKLYIEIDKDYYPGARPQDIRFAIQNYKSYNLVLMFFIFAFIGWCNEVVIFLLKDHIFVNRGVLVGPWLPIYGFGGIIILHIFTKTKFKNLLYNPTAVFFIIMAICGVIEYFTSWAIESFTGLRYWDYTGHFLNVNGRICLEGLCEFGVGGIICIYLAAPRLNEILNKVNKKVLITIASVLLVFLYYDYLYSFLNPRTGIGLTENNISDHGTLIGESE